MSEQDVRFKMQASRDAFSRLYSEHGVEVSWAKHPPSTLTDRFLERVLSRRNSAPLVYDIGCGEGGKAFYLARYGVRVRGFDVNTLAIQIAIHQAQELDLTDRVQFECKDILELELEKEKLEQADGVHDYQCINHIAHELHPRVATLVANLLPEGGVFLTNAFCRDTTNFYGEDISKRENGEFIYNGMYCYFFTREELVELYSPRFTFKDEEIIRVPHPFIEGRYHWEVLMQKGIGV